MSSGSPGVLGENPSPLRGVDKVTGSGAPRWAEGARPWGAAVSLGMRWGRAGGRWGACWLKEPQPASSQMP